MVSNALDFATQLLLMGENSFEDFKAKYLDPISDPNEKVLAAARVAEVYIQIATLKKHELAEQNITSIISAPIAAETKKTKSPEEVAPIKEEVPKQDIPQETHPQEEVPQETPLKAEIPQEEAPPQMTIVPEDAAPTPLVVRNEDGSITINAHGKYTWGDGVNYEKYDLCDLIEHLVRSGAESFINNALALLSDGEHTDLTTLKEEDLEEVLVPIADLIVKDEEE